jgi:hypothetical protein
MRKKLRLELAQLKLLAQQQVALLARRRKRGRTKKVAINQTPAVLPFQDQILSLNLKPSRKWMHLFLLPRKRRRSRCLQLLFHLPLLPLPRPPLLWLLRRRRKKRMPNPLQLKPQLSQNFKKSFPL